MSGKDYKDTPIKSVNPYTNKVEKVFEVVSTAGIDYKLAIADKAYRSWKDTAYKERAEILHKVADIFRSRKDEMARLATIEMGKLIKEGITEVELCADIFDYYATNGEGFLSDKPLESEKHKAFIAYQPLGVILSIQPWNFPYSQLVRNVAPIVMAGNTVVVKHASNIPQCAQIVEDIFRDAGAPQGVYTNLYLTGDKASDIVADKRIKAVTLTGSTPAGSSVAAVAGKYIKKSVLELGGSDPLIVLEDVNLDEVVKFVAMQRIRNAGQVCNSPKRIIVMEPIADEFISKARAIYENIKVGDPMDESTQLAPLSSIKAMEGVIMQVEETVKAGAKLVYGGKRVEGEARACMQPTILTDIKPGMVAYSEEIFGPVLCVFRVKTEDEAIELANDTEFGLGACIFTKDEERAIKLAARIESGMVGINEMTSSTPELPFGGIKNSGYGRELSPSGILEFVNHKLIRIAK